jgi:predicted Rossmann fold flavoprotein
VKSNQTEKKHIVVAGAGAAGLTAAWFAASTGHNVTLLERNSRAGNKIVMSGGSRCNLLPMVLSDDDYFTTGSTKTLSNVFKTWRLEDCKAWFEHTIHLELLAEEESNKWFPASQSGKEVRDALVKAVQKAAVQIIYDSPLHHLEKSGERFRLFVGGQTLEADAVIISTGGYSVPGSGTDGSGHRLLESLGVPAGPVHPALVPLLGPHPANAALQGISLEVASSVWEGQKLLASSKRSGFVFTHRGFSGPAILDLSHWIVTGTRKERRLCINWDGSTAEEWEKRLQPAKTHPANRVAEYLPARLADALVTEAGLNGVNLAECPRDKRKLLIKLLTAYELTITGNEGFGKAEVTGGGVPLQEINPKTMALRNHPCIFLCGEILDVFGRIGGFNFYWAWVSGRLAGLSAAQAMRT